ncbi:ABC transporter substrate-binding protein [Bordetella genomosp. 6]|uniref:ABC transporter substrate-binding protein n=1 Tax=Bordetella genomosp. 6 TaxID=463024 RepID=UPI000A2902D1|nr:ABC transporter substrate-binding protein [Bordetella genomosp. 6]ARP74776.1 hypothetical protein CAL11_00930 [Bordetella genomosp. 6]
MKLRLAENFRAVFYAPFYALKALGHAERAGLEIEWLAPGDPGGAIDAVKSGAIDLTWGGPMRVIKDHDSAPDNGASLLSFGEAVGRDPFSLVGRAGLAARDLHDLPSLRLGVVSEVPTPWYCLRADLHDRGIDIARDGRLVEGLTMPQQVQALADGTLDVAQLFEPCASQALAADGRLLYDASSRGPTVYTTFICTRDGLARNGAALAALDRALRATQAWIHAHDARDLARVTAPFFADLAPDLLHAAIERYRRNGIWSATTQVNKEGFDRLAHSLHGGGFVSSRMGYEACVHNFHH